MSTRNPDLDSELLRFYQIRTLNPNSWARDNQAVDFAYPETDDPASDEYFSLLPQLMNTDANDRSDYAIGDSSLDYMDPLGFHESIVDELIDRDVVESTRDPARLKYLIGSKSFNPKLFLKTIHNDKSFDQLNSALGYLDSEMQKRNKDLRQIVELEFSSFIKAKGSLDNIYTQFAKTKFEGTDDNPGLLGKLSGFVNSASASSTRLLNPTLESKSRELAVESTISFVQENKLLFNLPSSLQDYILKNDFDSLINDYEKGRALYDAQLQSCAPAVVKILNRVWDEVEQIISEYKENLWRRLDSVELDTVTNVSLPSSNNERNFLTTVNKLLELGVEDNPLVVFLESQYTKVLGEQNSGKCHAFLLKMVKLDQSIKQTYTEGSAVSNVALKYLYGLFIDKPVIMVDHGAMVKDLPLVMEMWMAITSYVKELVEGVLTKKIVRFGLVSDYFTNREFQRARRQMYSQRDPSSIAMRVQNANVHLELGDVQIQDIRKKNQFLITAVCDKLTRLFMASSQDLPGLLNMSGQPVAPGSPVKNDGSLSSYGFVPSFSNTISTLRYLLELQRLISESMAKLTSARASACTTASVVETLRETYRKINSRFISCVLVLMVKDAEKINQLETWEKSKTTPGCTALIDFMRNYFETMLPLFSDLVFNVMETPISDDMGLLPSYPAKKILSGIESQFVRALRVILEASVRKELHDTQSAESVDAAKEHRMLSLGNVSEMKSSVFPAIIQTYDRAFRSNLSKQNLDLYPTLENVEVTLFHDYIVTYYPAVQTMIKEGIARVDWITPNQPVSASEYIHKLIMFLIIAKSSITSNSTKLPLSNEIFKNLQAYMLRTMLDSLRRVDKFSEGGIYQLIFDLLFFARVLQNTLSGSADSALQQIYKEVVDPRFGKQRDYMINSLSERVKKALSSSAAEYACFRA
ncbi:unnamed protein product [Kuraishia capsulata CBS 1993]|uniref:Exocyst complex component SEC5 n=1 Tax=Kuraishia capsulata CBS 1993 TaxID=1382522 RepID=W6MSL8_9ASCO|nr:uncharacterized protein KUCA_T00004199001 [Kuraishia capsulata CBS 1993]CDK28217.1 unnamed protein product [Kuraishia capsulata CBS 1993]